MKRINYYMMDKLNVSSRAQSQDFVLIIYSVVQRRIWRTKREEEARRKLPGRIFENIFLVYVSHVVL
jgi:hypothetical protein